MTGRSEPQTISLLSLADRFIEVHKRMPNRSFAFVLGAGASRSSGIKGASQMVEDWIRSLHREATGAADGDGKAWANAKTLGIANYDPADPAACYSELYRRMYARDPDRGYAYLEEQLRESEPSYGYSVLARIMEDTPHNVVVTTNFDNLVADALSIFGKTYPLVCGHESLAGFISSRMRRPLVVKVHRDLLLAPKSAPEELSDLPEGFRAALTKLFGHYTPIVIGYGGNDGSLMGFLKNLPPLSVPGGVYWCYWEGDGPPPIVIRHFVAAQNGCLVPIPGFDEAMLLLGNELEFDVPDKFVLERAETRAKRIVEQVQALNARMEANKRRLVTIGIAEEVGAETPKASATAPDARHSPGDVASAAEPTEADVLSTAVKKTMRRKKGALRWWQWDERAKAATDLLERDRIYQEAIAALPDSAELLNSYAIFLMEDRMDHDKAETYFTQSLAVDPTNAVVHGNYAYFLKGVRKDHDKAETYYTQALAADPANATVLGNYAYFLQDIRKDHDKAETYYTQALAAHPANAVLLGNYAYFLQDVRKDHDKAETYYTQALAAAPTDAVVLGNYAYFLQDVRKDHDKAEIYYTQALAAAPTDANVLRLYADFLTDLRKDHDKAETYYTQALAVDPANAVALGNYAYFLQDVRKDHDKAETYYTQAIAAGPTNAFLLRIYADFLTDIRKDHNKAEIYYTQALAADPADAVVLGNYAYFLHVVRNDHDKAELQYKRALAVNPTDTYVFSGYARFLLSIGRTDEGLAMLDRAVATIETMQYEVSIVRVWMYATCHWIPDRWHQALAKLKRLLLTDKIIDKNGDFTQVIEAAKKRGHPAAEWLDPLAAVCAGTADASTLDGWEAWRGA